MPTRLSSLTVFPGIREEKVQIHHDFRPVGRAKILAVQLIIPCFERNGMDDKMVRNVVRYTASQRNLEFPRFLSFGGIKWHKKAIFLPLNIIKKFTPTLGQLHEQSQSFH